MSIDAEIYVEKHGKVALLVLNRPVQRNAFSDSMVERWADLLAELRTNPDVNVIVLTGRGNKAFCAGGDLNTLTGSLEATALERKNELWSHIHRVAFEMERIDKPVIAAINGVAVGAGLDMALMCDMRFMADTARVSEGYIRIGLVPGDGGAFFLPRIVGMSKALEMLWSGDFYSASECLAMGLVNRLCPAEKLLEETMAFATRLAEGPTVAIRMIKRAAYQSARLDMKTAFDLMSSHFAIVRETRDHKEGMAAMLEKRDVRFQGE